MLSQTVPLSSVLEEFPQSRVNALYQYAYGESPQKTKRGYKTQERASVFGGGSSFMMTTIQSKTETLPPIDQTNRYRQNTQASNSKSPQSRNKKYIYGSGGGGEFYTQKVNKKQPSLHTQQSTSIYNPLRSSSLTNRFNKSSSKGMNVNQSIDIDENNKIGQGNFGVVYKAEFKDSKEEVAVKRVLQDKNYKNRELQIMQEINHHPNIVQLKYSFYSFGEEEDEVYLNLIMEYVPSTLTKMIKYYHRKKLKQFEQRECFPNILVKLYLYQAFRALAYLNGLSIAHRDIKPSNILINHRTHQLKICDFGSAKKLSRGEANISYICSRAPELMLGAANYTTSVDVWSLGCVVAEMLLGDPLFKGNSSLDQLVEVMKVLGSPTPDQIKEMNPDHKLQKYPPINKMPLSKIFENVLINRDLLDLLEQMFVYEPSKRIKPLRALSHPYFNELRIEHCRINGKRLPPLYDFLEEELQDASDKQLTFQLLTPKWYQILKQAGEDKNHFNQDY